jgi:Fic family protein
LLGRESLGTAAIEGELLDAEPEGFSGGMTLRKAISLTKVSRATAWRDLAELVEQQAIEPIGEGRSRAYRLHWPGADA